MQPPLKNAAGYRSPYINALNAAATANEVVAGDLAIHRTPQGTTLRIPPRPRLRRFRLALGYLASTPVALLSEGNLILASGRAALLPGKDVSWSDAASPNPGWTSSAIPSSPGQWLDAILAQHIPSGDVYVVFQSGAGDEPDNPLHQLLPADLGTLAETDVSAIVTIGRFFIPASTSSSSSNAIQIAQYIADDIPALGLSTPTPFNHRFKVTAEPVTDDNGNTSITLHVRPGSVWKRDGDTLAPIGLTPVAPLVADGDGWTVPNAISGSVYIIQVGDAYQIKHSNPEGDTGAVLLRIADVTVTTSDPPTATVLQRQIGDFVLADPAGEEPPVAWRVALRKKEVSSGTIDQWQIFAPTWTVGRETLLPEGMEEDWNDLEVTSGTLYAVLTWTGTATTGDDGEVKTTWTPGRPTITNDLSAIPADDNPTPDDPSTSTIEGKEGHRSIIVKIGTFLTDDADPEVIVFLQIHAGSIIEDLNAGSTAPAAGEEFTYPFKVTVDENGALHVANGDVWERVANYSGGNKLKKIDKIWRGQNNIVEEGNGWKIENPTSGILYIGIDLNWVYNIFLNATANYCTNVCTIAEITVDSSGIVVKQCQVGDAIVDGYSSLPWLLRPYYSENKWFIESPYWIVGRERLKLASYTITLEDGDDVYAYLTWTGTTAEDSDGNTSEEWEHGAVSVTKDLSTIPADAPADRYGNGRRTIVVPIGFLRDGHFWQEHIGSIIADISTTQFTPAPAESDTLGPIEWDASRNSYVQYLGKWTWTGSAWVFAKKMNGNTAYPPAAVYPITAAQLLVRASRYGTPDAAGDNIAVIPFNLPFASAAATTWLTKHESTVSNGVVYTPPETVDGSGSLDSKTFTLTYWSDTGETNRQTNNLLGSIVEAANQTSTYEG